MRTFALERRCLKIAAPVLGVFSFVIAFFITTTSNVFAEPVLPMSGPVGGGTETTISIDTSTYKPLESIPLFVSDNEWNRFDIADISSLEGLKFEIDAQFEYYPLESYGCNSFAAGTVFGFPAGTNYIYGVQACNTNPVQLQFSYGSHHGTGVNTYTYTTDNGRHTYLWDGSNFYVDGNLIYTVDTNLYSITGSENSISGGTRGLQFGASHDWASGYPNQSLLHGNFYSARAWQNNVLLGDYTPYNRIDGMYGVLNSVDNVFYDHARTSYDLEPDPESPVITAKVYFDPDGTMAECINVKINSGYLNCTTTAHNAGMVDVFIELYMDDEEVPYYTVMLEQSFEYVDGNNGVGVPNAGLKQENILDVPKISLVTATTATSIIGLAILTRLKK